MRTRLALAILAVALTACTGPTEPTDDIVVVGNFTLISVDGLPVPATTTVGGDLILGRRIEIRADGTYTDQTRSIAYQDGRPMEVRETVHGSWVGHPQLLRLVPKDEEEYKDAWVYGPWLEIDETDGTWAFHLEFSGGSKFQVDREAVRH